MTDGPYFGPRRRPRRPAQPADVFPTPTEIADRAYELFVSTGGRGDADADYWSRAEEDLLDRAARRVTRASPVR